MWPIALPTYGLGIYLVRRSYRIPLVQLHYFIFFLWVIMFRMLCEVGLTGGSLLCDFLFGQVYEGLFVDYFFLRNSRLS